jgi:hypothetical protein
VIFIALRLLTNIGWEKEIEKPKAGFPTKANAPTDTKGFL